MAIFIIPLAAIIVFVFFFVALMLLIRRRQRNRKRMPAFWQSNVPDTLKGTAFIPPRNFVMPAQPTYSNFQVPMQPTQPIPTHNPLVNSPMPAPQRIPSHSSSVVDPPMPFPQRIPSHNSLVNPPMPVPQPYFPAPVISSPSTPPQPTESDLMERMRQVQMLMVEIHRLENESVERNDQRLQELKQRVIELSNTDGHDRVYIPSDPAQPPPAYPAHENNSRERPKY